MKSEDEQTYEKWMDNEEKPMKVWNDEWILQRKWNPDEILLLTFETYLWQKPVLLLMKSEDGQLLQTNINVDW